MSTTISKPSRGHRAARNLNPVDGWHQLVGIVNPLGRVVLALGVAAAVLAATVHWRELAVVAAGCFLLLALSLPFLTGVTTVRVHVRLDPIRVRAGESVSAGIEVTNIARRRLLPTVLELPVGDRLQRYGIPLLAPRATHVEAFAIRTARRGVIEIGRATTRRGDPLSVLSRDVSWTEPQEILVRPPMVALESLGAGLLRDLEGVSSDAISSSDLAFHALREYVPGDDLRHVHWRSSAKAMAAAGSSQLLVRQYLDTRRSHATILVEDDETRWRTDEAQRGPSDGAEHSERPFEQAMSVAASLAVRAVLDDFATSFVCGPHLSTGTDGNRALDAVCRAGSRPAGPQVGLVAAARRAAVLAPDTSLLFLIGSKSTDFETLQRAASWFSPQVRRIGIRVDPTSPSGAVGAVGAAGLPVLSLATRDDLGPGLRWSLT